MEYKTSLVIFSGPPLTGKTTFSKELAGKSNFIHFDVDIYRYELVGNDQTLPIEQETIVMLESYRRMHQNGLSTLSAGKPVSFAATYWRPEYKPLLKTLLDKLTIPIRIFELRVDDSLIEERVAKRQVARDPSDIKTFQQYLPQKIGFDPIIWEKKYFLDTSKPFDQCFTEVLTILSDLTIGSR